MKKILTIAALMLAFAATSVAQPRALGLRLGYGAELSYQHYMGGGENFLEIDLGLTGFNSLNVAGVYDWNLYQNGPWGVYGGAGAALGLGISEDNSHFHLALAGQIGVEYNFNIPLQLSLDLRPQIGYSFGANALYLWYYPALGVRYRF